MSGQKRAHSAAESVVNVLAGYGIAVAAQVMVFPYFGIALPLADNLRLGAVFTVISLVRSYALRRVFNWFMVREIEL